VGRYTTQGYAPPLMRLDTARRFALSLPETTEEPHFDMSSFRVKGKIFATVPPDGKRLHVCVGADEVRALVEEEPAAFEVIVWGKREVSDWVRVHLPAAERAQVCELLEHAWRSKAPKRVLAAFDESTLQR
jgi:hypothetical protein